MGKVTRKRVKSVGSVLKTSPKTRSQKNKQLATATARLSNTIIKKKKSKTPTRVINRGNKKINYTNKVMEIENNLTPVDNKLESINTSSSNVILSNNTNYEVIDITDVTIDGNKYVNSNTNDGQIDDIIDITDTIICNNKHENFTVPSKVTVQNIENDNIIDITDITIYENKSRAPNETVSCNNGVQNMPIEIVTISDDSEEENTSNQQSIEKQTEFKLIKEHIGISVGATNSKKRSYNSPLHKHNNMLKGKNVENEILPYNLGSFVVDKRKISNYSENLGKYHHEAATFSQKRHIPTTCATSTSNRKLRPIIIDGLNIGHAHGCGTFSAKGIALCINFFRRRGHKEIIAFLPHYRQGPPGSDTNILLNELLKKGEICFTPSRKVLNRRMTCYDDRILLNYANQCNGVVVSNDNFRDLYEESDAFKEIIENRHVMVTFVKDEIIVPDDQYNRKSDIRSLSEILCFPA